MLQVGYVGVLLELMHTANFRGKFQVMHPLELSEIQQLVDDSVSIHKLLHLEYVPPAVVSVVN